MVATHAAEPTFKDEKTYLLIRIAGDLAPGLADQPQDRGMAMNMAWRMVKSYHPSSEAEVTGAARIVSMSLLQLDLSREATQPGLTPGLKLQYARAVVSLNRAVCQAERALERRQRAEESRPVAQQPVEPERINRASNQQEAKEALVRQMLEEINLMEAARQQAEAAPPPEPVRPPSPVADPVEPPKPDEARSVPQTAPLTAPPHSADPAAFIRSVAAAHAQRHAALHAAPPPQAARPAGAGFPPSGKLAAGPG